MFLRVPAGQQFQDIALLYRFQLYATIGLEEGKLVKTDGNKAGFRN